MFRRPIPIVLTPEQQKRVDFLKLAEGNSIQFQTIQEAITQIHQELMKAQVKREVTDEFLANGASLLADLKRIQVEKDSTNMAKLLISFDKDLSDLGARLDSLLIKDPMPTRQELYKQLTNSLTWLRGDMETKVNCQL